MLAKLRDETGTKSPDADMLLLELARGLIRDQPRNARVIYLTGDGTNARSATSALGAENVLYAVSDWRNAHAHRQRVLVRGWWFPVTALGGARIPPIGRLLWDLLSACSFLRIEAAGTQWLLRPVNSILNGVPSDWADPWVEIEEPSTTAPESPGDAGAVAAPVPSAQPESAGDWLLPPIPVGEPVDAFASWQPTPRIFFELLWRALSGRQVQDLAGSFQGSLREAHNLLVALGAADPSGGPGVRAGEFRDAWNRCDLDWFHAEMQRLPGYHAAMEQLRADRDAHFERRVMGQLSIARTLGQVARLFRTHAALVVGDAPITATQLVEALGRWLPEPGAALPTEDLCQRAAGELGLTPARLEMALQRLWARDPNLPFEGQTGGTVTAGFVENVIETSEAGYHFRPVAPGALTFGRSGPVRFIQRTQ
jgi:hypothetical protein